MELFETIRKRHSYRGPFEHKPVPRDDLKKIIDAALKAPSGKNQQTTEFVVVDDKKIVERIREMHEKNQAMQTAQAYIACIIDTEPAPVYEGFSFQVEDCAAAAQNMLLAVTALRYAAVWVDGWLRLEEHAEKIGNLLGLPRGKKVRVLLPIGVPAEQHSQPEKKPFEERAWFNRYGGE